MTARRTAGSVLAVALAVVVIAGSATAAADPMASSPSATAAESTAGGDESVFTGEPSLVAQLVVAGLRSVRAATELLGIDLGTQLASLITTTDPPELTGLGLRVQRAEFAGMPVVTIRAAAPSGKVVVALHGGAYVVQPTVMHWLDYATMARDTGAAVVVPIYPLADTAQGRAASVVPALADLVTAQIGAYGAANVSLYGDSAGGGLALATAQELGRRDATQPSDMVLVSPWLDVSMSNPAIPAVADPILGVASLRKSGTLWAGALSLTDPLVSPLYGSLAGLPPTAVYSGSLDVLSPDVLVLRDEARDQGAAFTFVLREGLIHDWALGGLPVLPEGPAVRPDIYRQLGLAG